MERKISIPRCGIVERRAIDRHDQIARAQPQARELLPVAAGIDTVAALLAVGEYGLRPHDLRHRAWILGDQASHTVGDLGAGVRRAFALGRGEWRSRRRTLAAATVLARQQQCLELTVPFEDHAIVVHGIEPRTADHAVANFVYLWRSRAVSPMMPSPPLGSLDAIVPARTRFMRVSGASAGSA